MKKIWGVKLLFCLIFTFSFSTLAQEDSAQEGPELISVDFRETEITDALRLLAKQHNLNIIFSEDITGIITVQFSNVTVEDAIDAIITINGYAYTKRENVFKVTTPEAAEFEPTQTKMFTLNYATATEVRTVLSRVLSGRGSIEVDERSNSIVVTDDAKVIEQISQLLVALDAVTPQVLIETKVIETILSDVDKLGINWSIMATAIGAARPTSLPFLSGKGWSDEIERMYPPVPTANASFPQVNEGSFPAVAADDFTFGTLSFTQFQAILEMLETRSKTTVLSNPRILTLNNSLATVLVGTRMPIPVYERNESTGSMEITGYEEEEVGISLQVTPQVNAQRDIRMQLSPEVSSIIGYTGPNSERPIISTRQATTTVQIKDSQTVVIGGLIKEESVKSVRGIPVLRRIPILGLLFKKIEDTVEKTDLLIFVTAHVISRENAKQFTDKAILHSGRIDLFPSVQKQKVLKPKKETQDKKIKLLKPAR